MRHAYALALTLLGAIPNAHAASPNIPSVRAGTPYAQARQSLIRAGNIPADFRQHGRCAVETRDVCELYPEVKECAIDGPRPCNFSWTTAGKAPFIVTTVGEEVGGLKVEAVTAR
jgi:hypothetical protein